MPLEGILFTAWFVILDLFCLQGCGGGEPATRKPSDAIAISEAPGVLTITCKAKESCQIISYRILVNGAENESWVSSTVCGMTVYHQQLFGPTASLDVTPLVPSYDPDGLIVKAAPVLGSGDVCTITAHGTAASIRIEAIDLRADGKPAFLDWPWG